MGTSLTGLTPATTYDALIKVGDNGPLSATAKYLSDGLGNDSKLALSTSQVGVGTTSLSAWAFDAFQVEGASIWSSGNDFGLNSNSYYDGSNYVYRASSSAARIYLDTDGSMFFANAASGTAGNAITFNERLRITSAGNVGIGTSSPVGKLQVNGGDLRVFNVGTQLVLGSGIAGSYEIGVTTGNRMDFSLSGVGTYLSILPTGGITFNGDTAAANALDDYEEGTWTMGISFGGGSTGITYSINSGSYTKIGRQVTLNGYLVLSNKGSSIGTARITGLPFTIGNANDNYSPPTLRLDKITFADQFQGFGGINTTTIDLEEITLSGTRTKLSDADFANDSSLIISFTYFV